MGSGKLVASMVAFLLMATSAVAVEAIKAADPNEGWKPATKTKQVAIYSRPHPDSHLKEFKAIGAIDAPTRAVQAVLDDWASYPNFMPYMAECRLVKREGDSIVGYQRISPKICADRDYTLRIWNKSWPAAGGLVFMSRWASANQLGPPEKKGVVRVRLCEGSWLLEPDGATKTRATYSLYTDTGGMIPALIANYSSQTGISRLFEAIRKQVKNPKYVAAADGT